MIEISDPNERRIGPYTVVGTLARGATSEVVRAIDPDLNRTVAIKLLSKELIKDPEALARFERESCTVTVLDHPNIARIFEAGVSMDGQPYFVMEYVDGRSLMDLIRDKIEFELSQQIDMMIQAAEGLNAALNRQIIHRDIKPANLMLDYHYNVKVVDFGLAKVISEDAYKSVAGVVMGTPRYMAPEVAMGRVADYRSDIYSLGATFYHVITGQPPFGGDTPAAVMMQHVNSPLTPAYMINPEVPADVCEVIERAMSKDIDQRYQEYIQLTADLKEAKMARLAREKQASREMGAGDLAPGEAVSEAVLEGVRSYPVEPGREAPAVTGPRSLSIRPSLAAEARTSAAPSGIGEKRRSGNRMLLLLAFLFVVVVGGLLIATLPGGSPGDGHGFSALVGKVLSLFGGKEESPEDVYYRKYRKTLETIDFLDAAVREYVGAVGVVPRSLADLVDRKIITDDEMYDGFGGLVVYESPTRSLRAPGPDGTLNTLDDFLTDHTGRLIKYPRRPEKLALEEFITISGK